MAGSVAIVTGASGGIGSVLCRRLADAGMSLVLVDREAGRSEALAGELDARRAGAVVASYAVDLADRDSIAGFCEAAGRRFSSIQALFNNAGVLTDKLESSRYGVELGFEVNALAPLQLIDGLRPLLVAGSGVVVNTTAGIAIGKADLEWNELVRPSSFAKLYGPYVASKQALNVITAALGREMAAERVRVVAADPGPTRTRLTKGSGVPFWMRPFNSLLPSPEHAAGLIFDAGLSAKFKDATGAIISGGRVKTLPDRLATQAFQDAFLQKCRSAVAERTRSPGG